MWKWNCLETEVKWLCMTEAVLDGSCSTADVLGDVLNLLEHLMDKKGDYSLTSCSYEQHVLHTHNVKSCSDVLVNVCELEGVQSVAIPGDCAGPEHLLLPLGAHFSFLHWALH